MLYLYEIQVHKDYWRHKYGSRLMREVERAGVAASALGMVLTWQAANVARDMIHISDLRRGSARFMSRLT